MILVKKCNSDGFWCFPKYATRIRRIIKRRNPTIEVTADVIESRLVKEVFSLTPCRAGERWERPTRFRLVLAVLVLFCCKRVIFGGTARTIPFRERYGNTYAKPTRSKWMRESNRNLTSIRHPFPRSYPFRWWFFSNFFFRPYARTTHACCRPYPSRCGGTYVRLKSRLPVTCGTRATRVGRMGFTAGRLISERACMCQYCSVCTRWSVVHEERCCW